MNKGMKSLLILLFGGLLGLTATVSDACSRFTYNGDNNLVISARSMDWVEDMHSDLWAFPAGMKRTGGTMANSVSWVSKYGSVIAAGYNISAADGLNTEGLDANLLYLSSSNYGAVLPDHKNLSVLSWVQYVLDNYATVNDAVEGFKKGDFNMIAPTLPNGDASTVHLSITDKTGDNAVFEYVNGKLQIHHGKAFNVMTNEPSYDKQLALNDYWQNLKGVFLPGTGQPEDRFVRASYYLSTAPKTSDEVKAVAAAFSIIRDVSVPMSSVVTGKPNLAPTIWRSVADLTHKVYYFENTDRPNVFWVDISKLNLKSGAAVKKLALGQGQVYAGEVSAQFAKATPFDMH